MPLWNPPSSSVRAPSGNRSVNKRLERESGRKNWDGRWEEGIQKLRGTERQCSSQNQLPEELLWCRQNHFPQCLAGSLWPLPEVLPSAPRNMSESCRLGNSPWKRKRFARVKFQSDFLCKFWETSSRSRHRTCEHVKTSEPFGWII